MEMIAKTHYFKILNTYFPRKFSLLIFIKECQKRHTSSTVIDIVKGLYITQTYAYNLLESLENERRIKKSKKIHVNGQKYYNYMITKKAQSELKVISELTK